MQIKKHGEVPLHTKPNKKEWEIRVVDEYGTDEPVFKAEIETLYREQTLRSPRQERDAWGPLGDWNGHVDAMDVVDKTGSNENRQSSTGRSTQCCVVASRERKSK